jgi:TonB family protein
MQDEAARKKAFEDAVKQKLNEEMMKLQAAYTKQLQQQQAKNAPVPAAAPAPATPMLGRTTTTVAETQTRGEDHSGELSASQLDSRQREAVKPQDVVAQTPAPVPAPAPVVQQQAAVPEIPQVREGDVVDVSQLDVVPKRTRDPRVVYPPMAARQRIETNVLTSVLISETGDVLEVKVLRGDDRFGFTDAAVRALHSARYSPAMKDGKRVRTWLPQMIQFKPN